MMGRLLSTDDDFQRAMGEFSGRPEPPAEYCTVCHSAHGPCQCLDAVFTSLGTGLWYVVLGTPQGERWGRSHGYTKSHFCVQDETAHRLAIEMEAAGLRTEL